MTDRARTGDIDRRSVRLVDRDRTYGTGVQAGNSCSGIAQKPWEFAALTAGYTS